ncbi:30S ribosomal protein S11, chloroplastic [Capsicum annuum]|nr:30S ribosomal protein S11, chloroplastic [Capsicum annuum]
MAKAIPKISLHRNGRISSRKGARRIPKGVIHVQASFNNTIVTVTDVRGRVASWSSPGTSRFKGTRRGTPFGAQTAAANAIRTIVDQGKKYHPGKISKGVANGSAGSPIIDGSKMAKPTLHAIVLRITTGKI